ncbi:cupredoxin domain-containing protein [bacterium]|nr:MAG: cupredoxin domain-containing protein [bacterium]
MKNKGLVIVGVAILAAFAGYLIFNPVDNTAEQSNKEAASTATTQATVDTDTITKSEVSPTDNPTTSTTKPSNFNTSNSSSTPTGEDDIQSPDVMVYEIIYNGTSFSPASLTVKKGDIVIFKNDSDGKFRPASDDHPNHTIYPEFDADTGINAGGKYEFKFAKVGTWGFHDHINPSAKGTIKVQN